MLPVVLVSDPHDPGVGPDGVGPVATQHESLVTREMRRDLLLRRNLARPVSLFELVVVIVDFVAIDGLVIGIIRFLEATDDASGPDRHSRGRLLTLFWGNKNGNTDCETVTIEIRDF